MESVCVPLPTYDARVLRTPPHPIRFVARVPFGPSAMQPSMNPVDGAPQ